MGIFSVRMSCSLLKCLILMGLLQWRETPTMIRVTHSCGRASVSGPSGCCLEISRQQNLGNLAKLFRTRPTISTRNHVKHKKGYKPHSSPEFGGFSLAKMGEFRLNKPWLPNKVRKPARFRVAMAGPLLIYCQKFGIA